MAQEAGERNFFLFGLTADGHAQFPWTVCCLCRLMFWVFAFLLDLTPQGSLAA
jgi:hypothetical protein